MSVDRADKSVKLFMETNLKNQNIVIPCPFTMSLYLHFICDF